ncbi:hypothetical protein P5673_015819 [Acropora cervicornis]|uniref:UMA domain-containing protein n=1 Tax=Acropora cervicornis TaxID=6130 RepID=A0AAD9QHE0_ACRCE|nr:hypothetical protein P5673_015819 [Acropora cervicornis]
MHKDLFLQVQLLVMRGDAKLPTVCQEANTREALAQADFNPKDNSGISNEVFQQSSLSQYSCAASTSRMDIATGVTQGKLFPNRHTTFLTVSDVPMQLSKPFQLAQQMNQNTSKASRKSPPNVEQYQYDFTLERNVLHGH